MYPEYHALLKTRLHIHNIVIQKLKQNIKLKTKTKYVKIDSV